MMKASYDINGNMVTLYLLCEKIPIEIMDMVDIVVDGKYNFNNLNWNYICNECRINNVYMLSHVKDDIIFAKRIKRKVKDVVVE